MEERIESHPSGLRWIRSVSEGDRAHAIDTLFGASPRLTPLMSLTFDGPPGLMEPHYHTGTIAALITSGRLALDVGDDISERYVFGPGDIVYVPVNLFHGEEVLDGQPVTASVMHSEPFEVIERRPEG